MNEFTIMLIGLGAAVVMCGMCTYHYFRTKHLLNEMWAVDTYSAKELRHMCSGGFKAIVEVEGAVSCDKPVLSPALGLECCWCHTTVERKDRRTTYTKHGTRTRDVWVKDYDRMHTAVFKITDDTGYTLIDPTGAEVDAEQPHVEISYRRHPWFECVGYSDTGEYRITEKVFLPTGYAYVLGQASACEEEGTSPPVIVHRPGEGYMEPGKRFFLVSRKDEKELTASLSRAAGWYFWLGALSFIAIGVLGWLVYQLNAGQTTYVMP